MAISLRTGLPGHSKTLRTVFLIEQMRLASGASDETRRVVYQSGIPDLTLPWKELPDPREWYKLPVGSIIVIDEAQRVFPRTSSSAAVPEYIRALETHRHRGYDLFLVTQHPRLISEHVRALVEVHEHLRRPFGRKYAKIYRWQSCQDNPKTNLDECEQERFKFPVQCYGWYRSSAQHTVRARLPYKKLAVFVFCILFLATSVYLLRARFGIVPPDSALTDVPSVAVGSSAAAGVSGTSALPRVGTPAVLSTPVDWAKHWVPVVRGIPESAPVYQVSGQALRPVAMPVLSGCVSSAADCRCYTQQGTRVDVSPQMCLASVERPAFNPYRPDVREPATDSGAPAERAGAVGSSSAIASRG